MNPRCPSGHTRLPIVHLRPLGHLSKYGAGGIRGSGRKRPVCSLHPRLRAPRRVLRRHCWSRLAPCLFYKSATFRIPQWFGYCQPFYIRGIFSAHNAKYGAGGIRTPGTLASSMVFETISFNRSDTAPRQPIRADSIHKSQQDPKSRILPYAPFKNHS